MSYQHRLLTYELVVVVVVTVTVIVAVAARALDGGELR